MPLFSTRYHNDSTYWLFHLDNNPLLAFLFKKFVAITSLSRFLFLKTSIHRGDIARNNFRRYYVEVRFNMRYIVLQRLCICVVHIAYVTTDEPLFPFISSFSQQTSLMDGDKKRSAFCLQITYYNMRGTLNPECLKICSQYHPHSIIQFSLSFPYYSRYNRCYKSFLNP